MLSKFSVKRPFTVLVAVVIVIVFGVISFMKMTPDLFPNINTPYVMVMTAYPGASPEEAAYGAADGNSYQYKECDIGFGSQLFYDTDGVF